MKDRKPGDWPADVDYSKGITKWSEKARVLVARYLISKEGQEGVIVPPELKRFIKLYDEDIVRKSASKKRAREDDGEEDYDADKGGAAIDEGGPGAF